MLQETADEFHDVEGHGSQPGAFRLPVAKGNDSILHLDNAAVRDGHLEDIGSEILDARRAFAHGLAVDVPVGFPDLGGDFCLKADNLHLVSELGSEDFG